MQKIKTAIIGYGMATKFFHLPPLKNHEHFEVTHILTRDEKKHQAIYDMMPQVKIVSDIEDILSEKDIELVIIATSNDVHYTYTKKALLKGKHVVCEKPFVESYEEAKELFDIASQKGVILNVFHNREYDGDIITIKRLLEQEDFGKITHVNMRFDRLNPLISDNWRDKDTHMAGVYYDLAPHLVFDAILLFGKPKEVSLSLSNDRKEAFVNDHFEMTLTYESGLHIHLGAGILTRHDVPRFVIEGTNKTYVKYGFDQPDCNFDIKEDAYQTSGLKSILIDNHQSRKDIPLLLGKHYLFYDKLYDQIQTKTPYQANLALMVIEIMSLGLTSFQEKRIIELP